MRLLDNGPQASMKRYRAWLPLPPEADLLSLGEGDTPLIPSTQVGPAAGLARLFFKCEQLNPTGSYKDRFAAMQVSLMHAQGVESFLATSSGNTGAALAAYSARFGLRCRLFVTESAPDGKLVQMAAFGAGLYRVKGFGASDQGTTATFERLRRRSEAKGEPLVVSAYRYAPDGMEGVKSIAYEIAEQLPAGVDDVFLPVGGGGALTAVARGFADLVAAGRLTRSPRIHAVQPETNDTVVTPIRRGESAARAITSSTAISGLAVPTDIDGSRAIAAVRQSGGWGFTVSEAEVFAAQRQLLRSEGLYVEPAGAVSLAGALAARREGRLAPESRTVCVITGNGYKAMESIAAIAGTQAAGVIDPDEIERL